MRLHHLHLASPISYTHALRLQEFLLQRQFAYKAALRSDTGRVPSQPAPTLLTFQTQPTYTVGRRHLTQNPLSDAQVSFLTDGDRARFYASPRGGLLTYHAPGQLTGFLVLDLRRHGLTARCYVRTLERAVMGTCKRYGVGTVTTEDPGVWVAVQGVATSRKICAVGVHVSRGVTSHGIGLNVYDAPIRDDKYRMDGVGAEGRQRIGDVAPGYLSWGFSRIVACGLEGKTVTWMDREQSNGQLRVEDVAGSLASEVAVCLGMGEGDTLKIDEAQVIADER